jgi:hypothetical protein
VVAAGVCLVFLWAAVTPDRFLRCLPPEERYLRLTYAIPWFVLVPALAISTLRNPRASRLTKWSAGGILVVYLTSADSLYVADRIISALSYYSL